MDKENEIVEENKTLFKEIMEWIYCIIIAVVLALLVRYYIGTPTVVQQISMYPTYKQGDRLILNRISVHLGADFERGEVITFEAPDTDDVNTDQENPVAKYENGPKNIFSKFFYYALDINKKSYIKRVIGLPGEHIEIENGNVYVDGMLLSEEYLQKDIKTTSNVYTDFVVPEDCLFVMGDNRPDSMDSREFGCVPIKKVESKVWIRFWKARG